MTVLEEYNPDDHELYECEKVEGYLCGACHRWLLEQEAEWEEYDSRNSYESSLRRKGYDAK